MSEWQTDEQGRRFRRVGKSIEYEMLVTIEGGIEIPQSQLEAYHARQKAAAEARRQAEKDAPAPPPPRFCPFKDGLTTACDGERCALYLAGCTIAQMTDRPPAKDTAGLKCPIEKYNRPCRKDCALYAGNGCILTAIEAKKG